MDWKKYKKEKRDNFSGSPKNTTMPKKTPDFGDMYVSQYGDRTLTVFLGNYSLGCDWKECQIFFVINGHAGSIFCSKDCARKIAGKAFTAKIKPAINERYKASDGSEWITPFYFCDESKIELTGFINTTEPENGYGVDLTQPGPPVRIFF